MQDIKEIAKTEDLVEMNECETEQNSEPIYYTDPILISTECLEEAVQINKVQFDKGVDLASKYAGIYSALVSTGVSLDDSITLVYNILGMDMNVRLAEINKETQIEISKNQQMIIEKNQL